MSDIKHCFICRPSDFIVSEDAGIEPRTAATTALAVRRSNHSARSHPRSRLDLNHNFNFGCKTQEEPNKNGRAAEPKNEVGHIKEFSFFLCSSREFQSKLLVTKWMFKWSYIFHVTTKSSFSLTIEPKSNCWQTSREIVSGYGNTACRPENRHMVNVFSSYCGTISDWKCGCTWK